MLFKNILKYINMMDDSRSRLSTSEPARWNNGLWFNCWEKMVLAAGARTCDAQAGWRLSSVGSLVVRDLQQARQLLEQPRLKNGKVWLRFKAWSRTMGLDKAAVRSLQVL